MSGAPREVDHTLPAVERVEYQRKVAKELLRAARAGDPDALSRLGDVLGDVSGEWRLADAQRAIAQEHGLVIAREYGFPTWRKLLAGVREETAAWRHSRQPAEPMAAALEAIRAGDAGSLLKLLCSHPELTHVEVGAGGSLLGEVAQPDVFGNSLKHALGVDRECVDVLIEAGSDLDAPLNLAACFDRVELVQILLAAGARVDATGIWGITPLESAIYHASRTAADVLAAVELVPDAPWVAARAGRVDRLERFLDGHGGLLPEAYLHRPNPADVGWLHRLPARDDPQAVLDEALVHAAQNERPEAVARLLNHGADPNAGPYQGCGALHLAAAFGAIESVRLLVIRGADIDRTNDFKGATLYSTTFPCHNCARHIVGAGIARVVFVEPYTKSRAEQLHSDSIAIAEADPDEKKVVFDPFVVLRHGATATYSTRPLVRSWRTSHERMRMAGSRRGTNPPRCRCSLMVGLPSFVPRRGNIEPRNCWRSSISTGNQRREESVRTDVDPSERQNQMEP